MDQQLAQGADGRRTLITCAAITVTTAFLWRVATPFSRRNLLSGCDLGHSDNRYRSVMDVAIICHVLSRPKPCAIVLRPPVRVFRGRSSSERRSRGESLAAPDRFELMEMQQWEP